MCFPCRWWHHNDLNLAINSYNLGCSYSDMRSHDGWCHHFIVIAWILVWLFSLSWFKFSWCDFVCLVRLTETWYDFSSSWLKVSSGCDFFGVVSYLDAINCILVWFFVVLVDYFDLVWLCLSWCHFICLHHDVIFVFKCWYYLYISFYNCMYIFIYTCIYHVLCIDKRSCCYVKKFWIRNIFFVA